MAYIIDPQQKKEAEKILKELIRELKSRNTIRNILTAKDVRNIYQKEKNALSAKIEKFKNALNPIIKKGWSLSVDCPEFITSSNIVEIYFILMFSDEIDDLDLVSNYEQIENLLKSVTGNFSNVAKKFYSFLKSGRLISMHIDDAIEEILL